MKKVKVLTIILTIVLVTMIAFGGIYKQVQNRMENQIKDYEYAMDLKGTRNIRLKVNTSNKTIVKDAEGNEVEDAEELTDEEIAQKGYIKEEIAYNSEDVLNEENYTKSKKIIEKRLEKLGVDNYIIKLDTETGDIIVEIAENAMTDYIITNIGTIGKFEIIDTETNEVLMNNSDIKLANVMYGTDSNSATSTSTTVYLNIEFTKEGAKKIEDISNKYIKTEVVNETDSETEESAENTEEAETEESEAEETTTVEKTITMKIDDTDIMTTSFDETIKTGKIQLSVGSSATNEATLQENINQASNMAIILDTENMPVIYTVHENQYILSDISNDDLEILQYAMIIIIAIALVVLIIRYKLNGLFGAISYVGLVSIFTLLIRYANVILSIEGIFGIAIILILNYIFVNKMLSKLEKEMNRNFVINIVKETYKEFFIKIVPICIAVITFSFINWVSINSFGMVMFWGIALTALYNLIITTNLLIVKASK